jgi:P-type conjugative transfer protein TrbG
MSANSRSLRVRTLCGWAAGLALFGVEAAWAQSSPPSNGSAQLPSPVLFAPIAKTPSASPAAPPPVADLQPIRRPRHAQPLPGAATVRAANAAARSYPSAEGYINATLFYDYEVGRLYQVQTSPHFLTAIMLRPGEKLLAKAAGDTVRWVLGETAEGTGADQQVVVTTDQRTYLIEAASRDGGTYTSAVSWNYPQEQMQALAAAQAAQIQKAAVVVAPALAIDQLHFGYKIAPLKGKPPRWQPLRVFDDGTKTYIQFPINMAATDAPPLFLIGPHDTAELVNYRYINGYYVVDRLVDVAELRIGEKPQTIVRITRTGDRG